MRGSGELTAGRGEDGGAPHGGILQARHGEVVRLDTEISLGRASGLADHLQKTTGVSTFDVVPGEAYAYP
jgi:hypothetical protein